MLMSTSKLIGLRIYNITLGRFSIFSSALRKILIRMLIKDKATKYVATSKYFDFKDLGERKSSK